MHIDCGGTGYEWIEGWANLPATYSSRTGWSHHGLALTDSGKVVSYHQADGTVLVLDQDGNLERSWASGLAEGHGITAVKDGDAEFLWIADNGRKRTPATAYEYPESGAPTVGQVVKMSMDGETVLRLPTPPVDAYRDGDYMPTWVAVNEERHGGNGDVWVTDGYAVDLVHRYDKSGNYLGTITGEDGRAGKFNNPHAILMDTRKSEPELYVADRGNGRVQVYDAEGVFKRAFGESDFIKPSGLTLSGDHMVVADLNARLSIVDPDDALVCHLGDNHDVTDVEGWPNNVSEGGDKVRPGVLRPGKFNSPHGVVADHHGNIYVAEWLIGGRYIKLAVE